MVTVLERYNVVTVLEFCFLKTQREREGEDENVFVLIPGV